MYLCTAFTVYDWLINLDQEITSSWFWDFRKGRRLTAASLLYGLSRYPPMILQFLGMLSAFPMSDMVGVHCCDANSEADALLGVCSL